jgi:phage tail sheath gpL-like
VAATGAITFAGTGTATGTATVTINGTNVTYVYTTSTTATAVASQIVIAIGANTTTNALVAATSSAGVVNLTAQTAGYTGNSITYLATTTASTGITVTPITATHLTGGLDSTASSDAWSCNSPAETNTSANFWRIPSGSTATCTFTDHITNTNTTAGGWFQPKIDNISWMTSATTTGDFDQTTGLTGLQTSQFYLGI